MIAAVVAVAIAVVILINVYYAYTANYVCDIGGEKVTKKEFLFILSEVKNEMLNAANEAQQGGLDAQAIESFWTTKIDGKDASEVAKERALQSAKDLKVQLLMAKKNKIALSASEAKTFKDTVNQLITRGGGEQAVMLELMQYGISDIESFVDVLLQYKLAEKFFDVETSKYYVSDEDIRNYYDENSDKFKWPKQEESVWVRHILLKTIDANDNPLPEQAIEEVRQDMEAILEEAKAGEDFGLLAMQYSQDPGSASNGGQYLFARGTMVEPFEQAAFSLQDGEISGIVETAYGYHIIKLEEKISEGQPISFEGAQKCYAFNLGENYIKNILYRQNLESWKNEYEVNINHKVYDAIKVQ